MELKPQDVVMLLRILAYGTEPWTYSKLSGDLGISTSQLHMAVQRCVAARLIEQGAASKPFRTALKEFLMYGVKYTFPVERKGATRGIPTGFAARRVRVRLDDMKARTEVWNITDGHDGIASRSPRVLLQEMKGHKSFAIEYGCDESDPGVVTTYGIQGLQAELDALKKAK